MSRNIRDMFNKQVQRLVTCPACEISVPTATLNEHLDRECISSPETEKIPPNNFSSGDHAWKSTCRLSREESCVNSSLEKVDSPSDNNYSSSDKCISLNNEDIEKETGTFQFKKKQESDQNGTLVISTDEIDDESDIIASVLDGQNVGQSTETSVEKNENESSRQFSQDSDDSQKRYVPYYLANFKHIIKTVLEDLENQRLFNEVDKNYIDSFNNISDAAQKLYVRLFQRKFKWHRHNKINYPEIASDLSYSFKELIDKGLIDSDISNIDLETALDLLSLPEMKNLSKQFSFIPPGKNKQDTIQLLLKHSRQHRSFFASSKSSVSAAVLKKVQQVLGPCYKLALEPKKMFTRILMLFSLPNIAEDEDEAAGGQQQQLFTLLQVNKGELKFPKCNGKRMISIFDSREDLVRYENAKQLENDILLATENKNFELAKESYINAVAKYEALHKDGFPAKDSILPPFLRRYTAGHVYTRCIWLGVEVLQKLRKYQEAVDELNMLLRQKVYCQDYRPRWWDRLALNLEQHLKQRVEAAKVIKEALQDVRVRGGHRLSLLTRAQRLNSTTDQEEAFKNEISKAVALIEAPKVVIRGRLFPRTVPGRKHVFISSGSQGSLDEVTVLGVENLALEHYKSEGYTEGIHGEGSTFISLYGLLFWDIIYNGDIPDVFISPYQSHPLDLNCDFFFQSREKEIHNQLNQIRSSTIEDLEEIVASTWNSHAGEVSLVSWDRFDELKQVQGLVKCMGIDVISGICERLAKDFRHTRSGVPDLVVWNPESLLFKVVEVKGPSDRLSTKQMLWIDYLIKIGAQVELCLVEAVGAKRLKKDGN